MDATRKPCFMGAIGSGFAGVLPAARVAGHAHDTYDTDENVEGVDDDGKEDELCWALQANLARQSSRKDHGSDDLRGHALKDVCRAADAVAHHISYQVRDDGWVARVILGHILFDLANKVCAHVRGLGVDATSQLHEHCDERGAKTVARQQQRNFLQRHRSSKHQVGEAVEHRNPADAHDDGENRGESTALEAEDQRLGIGAPCRAGHSDVRSSRNDHGDVAANSLSTQRRR